MRKSRATTPIKVKPVIIAVLAWGRSYIIQSEGSEPAQWNSWASAEAWCRKNVKDGHHLLNAAEKIWIISLGDGTTEEFDKLG